LKYFVFVFWKILKIKGTLSAYIEFE
jgi:hypothetical protein